MPEKKKKEEINKAIKILVTIIILVTLISATIIIALGGRISNSQTRINYLESHMPFDYYSEDGVYYRSYNNRATWEQWFVLPSEKDDECDDEYNNRFYKEALADFLYIQIYMYPFNENDTVTLQMSSDNPIKDIPRFIYINHTEPNPDYAYIGKYVYRYKMHFTHILTWEEIEE